MPRVNLGLNIEAARRLAWLSQRDLADKIGVSQVSLCQYERGVMRPPEKRLQAISRVCNVPVHVLTDWEWDRGEHCFKRRREYLKGVRGVNRFVTILPARR